MSNSESSNLSEDSKPSSPKSWMRFFWWLRKLAYLWLKSSSFPQKTEDLQLDPNKPICYVLNSLSLADLLVLDHHCEKFKIAPPRQTLAQLKTPSEEAAYFFLSKTGLLQKKREKVIPSSIHQLLEKVKSEGTDIQLVPVSIFWGRNPGKEEKSLFKLLFFDDEHGGWFQRFILFFVQGRNVICDIGKPISILKFLETETDQIIAAKKLRLVLRVHFRKQREASIGPYLYDRRRMMRAILDSKLLKNLIDQEVEKKGKDREKLEEQALKYIDEIAANMSLHVVRFFTILLSWLFRKIYKSIDVHNGGKLHGLAHSHTLIYLPCHRSHMDYLLLGYTLYTKLGVTPPHTAAGINLNFWPMGFIFRRGGAFFIRRSFGGNRLYNAVFTEYVNFLIGSGYPMCFYTEGGRSRTGKLLQPKLGMLNMVLNSSQQNPDRPIALVPIYIGYDKLMEARSYLHELRGKTKKVESLWQLLKAPKVLAYEFGKAYLNFGDPIVLHEYFQEFPTNEENKSYALSRKVMQNINKAICVSPVSLFSIALLALPKKAIAERELLALMETWLTLLRKVPYDEKIILPDQPVAALLKDAEKLSHINRFEHETGDVIFVDEKDSAFLSYYRNNALSLFVVPSLIAHIFSYYNELETDKIATSVIESYKLLRDNFFLKWEIEDIKKELSVFLEAFVSLGLLQKNNSIYIAPEAHTEKFSQLAILGRVIGKTVERYCIYISIFARHSSDSKVSIAQFSKECEGLAKKSSLLSGYQDFEFFDKNEQKHFIDTLTQLEYIQKQDQFFEILPSAKDCIANASLLIEGIEKNLTKAGNLA